MEACRGHPRDCVVTSVPDSDSYSGASCGPSCVAKPQSPGTVRVQGGGPGPWFFCLSCCGPAAWGSHGVEPGPQLEGRQRGSRWFGQSTAGTWNHRPVSVFHCSTTLSAARPGVGRGAQAGKLAPPGRSSSSSRLGAPWACFRHPEPLFLSVSHLHSPPYLPSWEQCEGMRRNPFDVV